MVTLVWSVGNGVVLFGVVVVVGVGVAAVLIFVCEGEIIVFCCGLIVGVGVVTVGVCVLVAVVFIDVGGVDVVVGFVVVDVFNGIFCFCSLLLFSFVEDWSVIVVIFFCWVLRFCYY